MSQLFHVGITVPDLDEAMEQFGTILSLEWRQPFEARRRATDDDGNAVESRVRVAFSDGGPFAVELIEGKPVPHGFDHIGYWTGDWNAERDRLEREGFTCEITHNAVANRSAVFTKGPFGTLFEACDTHFEREGIADLYPHRWAAIPSTT